MRPFHVSCSPWVRAAESCWTVPVRGLVSWTSCLAEALLEDTAALITPPPKRTPSAPSHQVNSGHKVKLYWSLQATTLLQQDKQLSRRKDKLHKAPQKKERDFFYTHSMWATTNNNKKKLIPVGSLSGQNCGLTLPFSKDN